MSRPEHTGRWTLIIAAVVFIGPLGAWGIAVVLAQNELEMRLALLPPHTMDAERYIVMPGPGADEAEKLVEKVAELPFNDRVWNFPDADHPLTDIGWQSVTEYLKAHRAVFESSNAMLARAGDLSGDYCVRSGPYEWQRGLRMLAALYAIDQEALVRRGQRDAAWASWFTARPLVRLLERLACVSKATSHISWKSLIALEHLLNREPIDASVLQQVRKTLQDETRLQGTDFGDWILHNAFAIDRAVRQGRRVPWLREIVRSDSALWHREALDILKLPLEKRLSAFVAWERSVELVSWKRSASTRDSLVSYGTPGCCLGYAYEGAVMARARHGFALCAIDLLTQYQREGNFPAVAPKQCQLDESGKAIEFKVSDKGFTLTLAGGWDWPNHVAWTYAVPDAPVPHVE